ncbi:MAG TPA: DinB family protein [Bryobacteraceae bacterium]|nr:DinB family protein [Bryobacteraceae bacterium]
MTNDQAEFLLQQVYLPQIQNERQTTRRVIEAVPAANCEWKPDPKSMSAIELAWHIAASECFFINGVVTGEFNPAGGAKPDSVKTPADVLAWYDENIAKATAGLASLKGEALTRMIDFRGVFNMPGIVYIGLMSNHSIHHRGQLSAYLRPMGSKVPRIYGGSADEPMELPAKA